MNRNLDGVYFRVERDGKWQSICFSDLTEEERFEIMKNRDKEWLVNLCNHLANCLAEIGYVFDITRGDDD